MGPQPQRRVPAIGPATPALLAPRLRRAAPSRRVAAGAEPPAPTAAARAQARRARRSTHPAGACARHLGRRTRAEVRRSPQHDFPSRATDLLGGGVKVKMTKRTKT